jgi:ribonuclease Z
MVLEIFVLGTGGMMPLPGRSLTSVLLRREGELLLFDCGEGTQVSLRRLNLKWKKISRIFISHTHADHVTGIPGILMLSSQVERDEPLYIYGPPRIKEYVEESCRILDMYINYEIDVREITKPGVVYEADEYRVVAFPLHHSKPCFGYALEEFERPGIFYPERAGELGVPRGPLWSQLQHGSDVTLDGGRIVTPAQVMGLKRRGRKFGFVTDTLYKPTIAEPVAHADLLICEGMFADDMADNAVEKKHLTARQAGIIARDAGVKRLGLIHYSPRYTNRELCRLLEEAQSVFAKTFLTKDCQSIDLHYEDGPDE